MIIVKVYGVWGGCRGEHVKGDFVIILAKFWPGQVSCATCLGSWTSALAVLKLPGPHPSWVAAPLQEGGRLSSPVHCQSKRGGARQAVKRLCCFTQSGPVHWEGRSSSLIFKKMTEVVMKALELHLPSACSPLTPTLLSAASCRKLASS